MKKNIESQKTFLHRSISITAFICNENDKYKLTFLERLGSDPATTSEDMMKWLTHQDIYFSLRFKYDIHHSPIINYFNFITYKELAKRYPVSDAARIKYESQDEVVADILAILREQNKDYNVYTL
jgi:hypothetical protein